MKNYFYLKYPYFIIFCCSVFTFQSCKTDEFKFGDISIKEDWAIDVISPLFVGKGMEFRDFIFDWKKTVPSSPGPFTVLDYSNSADKTIPSDLIFSPSVIIDSLPFYIQGSYRLSNVELVFTVNNGSPFPLNLQLQFFDKQNPVNLGKAITPPAFKEANFNKLPVVQAETVFSIELDSVQLHSFNNSDRVKFTSWYNSNEFINQNDTLSAHYPVDVSIILRGVVQGKNE